MAQQTINVGTAPNDGTGTPLRTAFQYTNSNFSELYTAVGPSGNNIVCPGSATITGDLTVDTSTLKVDSANNRVGINTASPVAGSTLHIVDSDPTILLQGNQLSGTRYNRIKFANQPGSINYEIYGGYYGTGGLYVADYTNNGILFGVSNTPGTFTERYKIDSTGVATWSNVGGVAGTAMTLNSTGLGVGRTPGARLDTQGTTSDSSAYAFFARNSVGNAMVYIRNDGRCVFGTGASDNIFFEPSGNVGIGVTPSTWASLYRAQTIRNHISQFAFWDGSDSLGGLVNGAYINSSYTWTYSITGKKPSMYVLSEAGNHVWSVAGTGTVGGAVTWTPAMALDASGNLLVGTTAPLGGNAAKFHLSTNSGTTRWAVGPYSDPNSFIISAVGGSGVYLNGTAATSWTSASDERLKDIIEPISNAVAKVGSLRAVIGKFKFDQNNTRKPFLLAQDLQSVLPEAVDASNPDQLGVAYTDVIPLLVAAIKELTARVQTLETR